MGISTLPTDKVKFHWGVFKMPEVTSATTPLATPNNRVGIWGAWNADAWSIPVTTKTRGHLALALDFLHWITTSHVEIPVDLAGGLVPTVADYHPTGLYKLYFDVLTHPSMQFAAEATLGPEWLRNRIAMQQAYITGMQSLDQTMSQMQRFTDDAASRIAKIYHLSY
jgi:ABC-type glycerol-3-phosphate transport system substrate-binding protein